MTSLPHRIPIAAPGRAYLSQKEAIDSAVSSVLHRGHYIQGQECRAFEKNFSAWVGVRHGIGVASGTDALSIALQSAGLKPGDGIVTAANTAGATIAAVEAIGCVPILADIQPDTFNLCPESAKAVIEALKESYSIRGMIPVHMYGQAAPMDDLLLLAKMFDLVVIEDAAQAHGATWNEKPVGSWGHAAAFSFYPTKNLGAFGDAGMLVTTVDTIEKQARELRQYGWRERQVSYQKGINSRMDELQAAILNTRLKQLNQETTRRRAIAAQYQKAFQHIEAFQCPIIAPTATHVFHQYVIRYKDRDTLAKHLDACGIDTVMLYPNLFIYNRPGMTS